MRWPRVWKLRVLASTPRWSDRRTAGFCFVSRKSFIYSKAWHLACSIPPSLCLPPALPPSPSSLPVCRTLQGHPHVSIPVSRMSTPAAAYCVARQDLLRLPNTRLLDPRQRSMRVARCSSCEAQRAAHVDSAGAWCAHDGDRASPGSSNRGFRVPASGT